MCGSTRTAARRRWDTPSDHRREGSARKGGNTPAVAVGYIRRSHESDARTVSLAAQRATIEQYATERGWPLAAVLEHDGISGGKRSRFAHLDTANRTHGARFVMCYHLD